MELKSVTVQLRINNRETTRDLTWDPQAKAYLSQDKAVKIEDPHTNRMKVSVNQGSAAHPRWVGYTAGCTVSVGLGTCQVDDRKRHQQIMVRFATTAEAAALIKRGWFPPYILKRPEVEKEVTGWVKHHFPGQEAHHIAILRRQMRGFDVQRTKDQLRAELDDYKNKLSQSKPAALPSRKELRKERAAFREAEAARKKIRAEIRGEPKEREKARKEFETARRANRQKVANRVLSEAVKEYPKKRRATVMAAIRKNISWDYPYKDEAHFREVVARAYANYKVSHPLPTPPPKPEKVERPVPLTRAEQKTYTAGRKMVDHMNALFQKTGKTGNMSFFEVVKLYEDIYGATDKIKPLIEACKGHPHAKMQEVLDRLKSVQDKIPDHVEKLGGILPDELKNLTYDYDTAAKHAIEVQKEGNATKLAAVRKHFEKTAQKTIRRFRDIGPEVIDVTATKEHIQKLRREVAALRVEKPAVPARPVPEEAAVPGREPDSTSKANQQRILIGKIGGNSRLVSDTPTENFGSADDIAWLKDTEVRSATEKAARELKTNLRELLGPDPKKWSQTTVTGATDDDMKHWRGLWDKASRVIALVEAAKKGKFPMVTEAGAGPAPKETRSREDIGREKEIKRMEAETIARQKAASKEFSRIRAAIEPHIKRVGLAHTHSTSIPRAQLEAAQKAFDEFVQNDPLRKIEQDLSEKDKAAAEALRTKIYDLRRTAIPRLQSRIGSPRPEGGAPPVTRPEPPTPKPAAAEPPGPSPEERAALAKASRQYTVSAKRFADIKPLDVDTMTLPRLAATYAALSKMPIAIPKGTGDTYEKLQGALVTFNRDVESKKTEIYSALVLRCDKILSGLSDKQKEAEKLARNGDADGLKKAQREMTIMHHAARRELFVPPEAMHSKISETQNEAQSIWANVQLLRVEARAAVTPGPTPGPVSRPEETRPAPRPGPEPAPTKPEVSRPPAPAPRAPSATEFEKQLKDLDQKARELPESRGSADERLKELTKLYRQHESIAKVLASRIDEPAIEKVSRYLSIVERNLNTAAAKIAVAKEKELAAAEAAKQKAEAQKAATRKKELAAAEAERQKIEAKKLKEGKATVKPGESKPSEKPGTPTMETLEGKLGSMRNLLPESLRDSIKLSPDGKSLIVRASASVIAARGEQLVRDTHHFFGKIHGALILVNGNAEDRDRAVTPMKSALQKIPVYDALDDTSVHYGVEVRLYISPAKEKDIQKEARAFQAEVDAKKAKAKAAEVHEEQKGLELLETLAKMHGGKTVEAVMSSRKSDGSPVKVSAYVTRISVRDADQAKSFIQRMRGQYAPSDHFVVVAGTDELAQTLANDLNAKTHSFFAISPPQKGFVYVISRSKADIKGTRGLMADDVETWKEKGYTEIKDAVGEAGHKPRSLERKAREGTKAKAKELRVPLKAEDKDKKLK